MAIRDRLPFNLPFSNDPARNSSGQPASPLDTMVGHTLPEPAIADMPMPRAGAFPLGQSGRANFYGLPQPDELNPELIGTTGLRRFNEMYRSDAHLRRLVLAAWSPVVAGTWTLEPFGGDDATDQDRQIAEDIWWMLTEWMTPNFFEHLYQVGPLLLRSGFCPCEQIWATVKRNGKTLLGPRKLDIRLPISIWRWWQDDFGELTHIGQILPSRADVIIPATELVYYRLGAEGDNWAGVSLLRNCYKNAVLKDRLERIDSIGQERKAVGVPIIYPPTSASPQVKAQVERLVASMHTSEVAYLMMPGPKAGSQGSNGVPQEEWLIDVIKFDSSSGEGIMNSIAYHQQAIAASFLTDFLELGHHQVGARATAEVQEDPFLTAINGALLPPVIPPLNRLIDRIRLLNWDSAEGSPQLRLTLNDEASLSEIAAYATPLIQAEAIQVDPELEDWLRDRAGMPAANAEVRAQNQAAKTAGLEAAAQQLAQNGETQGEEPPSPNADPATAGQQQSGAAKPGQVKPQPPAAKGDTTGNQPSVKPTKKLDATIGELIMLEHGGGGAMLALIPDKPFANVDEAASKQHLTLAYLGKAADMTDEQHVALRHIAHAHAASMAPVKGSISGTTQFGDAHVALVSSPGLSGARSALAQHLQKAGLPVAADHDFLPHVTYSYKDGKNPPVSGAPMKFSHLAVVRAGRTHKIALSGKPTKTLDTGFAPMSGGVASETGLQMVPEVAKCSCGGSYDDGKCEACGAKQPDTKKLDAPAIAEPTAKWFEKLLSQDQLRAAFDGARDHIQAACEPQTILAASKLAHQAANGTSMSQPIDPPADLTGALTKHYMDMYQLGAETVAQELAKQRGALGKTLDDAGPDSDAAATVGSRLARARQRGEHSARNIVSKIQERLGRDQITGLKDPQTLQDGARKAAVAQLRVEALANTAASVNDGRNDYAQTQTDIAGAFYTCCLDDASCDSCIAADTGDMLSPEDAVALGPPNPDCSGGDYCRCTLVWVMADDPAALAAVT